jgi:hypothetical protein
MVSNIYAEFYLVVQTITKMEDKSALKSILYGVESILSLACVPVRARARACVYSLSVSVCLSVSLSVCLSVTVCVSLSVTLASARLN